MGIGSIDQTLAQDLLQTMQSSVSVFQIFGYALSIVAYVFMSIGLYVIAQKRNIRHPWLAWIPVARMWLLGSISDHYYRVAKGEARNRRTRLLVSQIILAVLTLILAAMVVLLFMQIVTWGFSGQTIDGVMSISGLFALIGLLTLPMVGVAIWIAVETFYAYHDLFCSCSPANKTLFTVLSIVLSCLGYPIVAAVLIFVSRNKTDGLATQSTYSQWGQQGPEF